MKVISIFSPCDFNEFSMGGEYGGYWTNEAFGTNYVGPIKETEKSETQIKKTLI